MVSEKAFCLRFLSLVLCATMIIPDAASAAYYNTYTTVDTLPDAQGCTAVQGFAVGSTYVYSIKIKKDETRAVIYRTRMSDGTTTLMKNGDDGTTYATYLGHGNDIALHSNDGKYYMFVVTMKKGAMSLVKLQYVGNTYYKVGNYTIRYNGEDVSMSGVAITGKDSKNIYFLFKSSTKFYRGSLPINATSGTIHVMHAFDLNVEDALVNGKPVKDFLPSWTTQGIGLGLYKDTLYFPVTETNDPDGFNNISVVLVYRNISAASGTIYADDDLSFRITSSAYKKLFEIEGVGIANGDKLWFNTNRTTEQGTASDNVGYFNGYSASDE